MSKLSKAFSFSMAGFALVALVAITMQTASAAQPAKPVDSEQQLTKDINLMENRFFSRQYSNDPLEKRIERLELLVYGATQDGTNEERFGRLRKAVGERMARFDASMKKPAAPAEGKTAPQTAAKDDSSTQYPVLNTLEWRALKQTYPKETLDQRLARLETKLFGKDSATMPYFERVERLKRTLGIGVVASQPSGIAGPMPKARPRAQSPDYFGWSTPSENVPPFGDATPPGVNDPLFGDLHSTINQMLHDMTREMGNLNRMGPGQVWTFDSDSGTWTEHKSGQRVRPIHPGNPRKKNETEQQIEKEDKFQMRQHINELPPYADPNSI